MKGKKFTHEGKILAMPRLASPTIQMLAHLDSTTKVRKYDLSIKSTQVYLPLGYAHILMVTFQ